MLYILLISGLIIIYTALRLNINSSNKAEEFDLKLNDNIQLLKGTEIINKQLSEILDRIENIEKSIIILNDTLNQKLIINETRKKEIENNTIFKNEYSSEKDMDLNNLIYKLYDDGLSIDEISSKLMIGKGEVLLRIGLRKQK